MLAVIDIGNTSTKTGFFGPGGLEAEARFPTVRSIGPERLSQLLPARTEVEAVAVATVVREVRDAYEIAVRSAYGTDAFFIHHDLDFGFEIDYSPKTDCGIDRLVAASALASDPGAPFIVCDLGTATTIDVVTAEHGFRGGVIAPGMSMLARSLADHTSALPLVDPHPVDDVIGRSTKGAIASGVYFGYLGLVEGILRKIIEQFGENVPVIGTGGFAEYVYTATGLLDEMRPDLVLEGIASVYNRNREQILSR